MTPIEYRAWLDSRGDKTIAQVAKGLGKSKATILSWRHTGTSEHTDLAIEAYDARIKGKEDE